MTFLNDIIHTGRKDIPILYAEGTMFQLAAKALASVCKKWRKLSLPSHQTAHGMIICCKIIYYYQEYYTLDIIIVCICHKLQYLWR